MAKFIVIEGADGSGKATQTALLAAYMETQGRRVRRLEFPDYAADGSLLARMYLRGDFGTAADAVNAYAAATFFAMDRYTSYRLKWQEDYAAGAIILADRYTTSNMVHQSVKLAREEREAFLDWLLDYEYEKLGLPKPDLVIHLSMETEVSNALIAARAKENGEEKDIHEADGAYLARVHNLYEELAARYGWVRISCTRDGVLRSIAEIQEEIRGLVLSC